MTAPAAARDDADGPRPAPALLDPDTLLDDLEAGRIRAAEPDPAVPGGWRVRPEVKAAILERVPRPDARDLGGRAR